MPSTVHPAIHAALRLRRLGIDTAQESVIYMREDCHICRSEGFSAHARVRVELGDLSIVATVNVIRTDLLAPGEAALSEAAWRRLGAVEGSAIHVRHTAPVGSLGHVRAKIFDHRLEEAAFSAIIEDILAGMYSDIHIAAFISACAGDRMDLSEMVSLSRAMVSAGDRIDWNRPLVVDKHCVGGLPGNRTTPIVVAVAAAAGLVMPKTSSRAITSPAGTADAMETLAPVDLDIAAMRRVVDAEGGCIVWGGAVRLSPADDILIRIERALDIDSEGQLVASVLSKKVAAGSTHVVLDVPVGPTAKVRDKVAARALDLHLTSVARELGLTVSVVATDGAQPVGRGIGPALEGRDVLSVLRNEPDAPQDLRIRAVRLAGEVLELSGKADPGQGIGLADSIVQDGRAWSKFQAICEAQGGMREPPEAGYKMPIVALNAGRVASIDNRLLARVAKLAGAPSARAAGLVLHAPIGTEVDIGEPVFTIHAETPGELAYAAGFAADNPVVVSVEKIL